MKFCLKKFFGRPHGPDLRDGVAVVIGGESRLVMGEFGAMIQDERAHKFVTHCKRVSGIKPCCLCKNLVLPTSNLLPDPTGYLMACDSFQPEKFDFHTSASLKGIQIRLRELAAEGDTTALHNYEVLMGFSFEPESMLQDTDLDVDLFQVYAWDWMHCYLVNGTFDKEAEEIGEPTASQHLLDPLPPAEAADAHQ